MECQIKNSLVVGSITSIIGTVTMTFLSKKSERKIKNMIKHLFIFFIIGIIVHIVLEYFNFNSLCYDKKCYGDLCRGDICRINL